MALNSWITFSGERYEIDLRRGQVLVPEEPQTPSQVDAHETGSAAGWFWSCLNYGASVHYFFKFRVWVVTKTF